MKKLDRDSSSPLRRSLPRGCSSSQRSRYRRHGPLQRQRQSGRGEPAAPADHGGALPAAAGRAAVSDGPLLRRLHRRHAEHPARQCPVAQPGRPQPARWLLDDRRHPRAFRERHRCQLADRKLGARDPGADRQRHQGDRRCGAPARDRHGSCDRGCERGLAADAGVGNTILEIRPLKPLVPSTGPPTTAISCC